MVDVPLQPSSTRHSTVASSSRWRIARVRSSWGTRAVGDTPPSSGAPNKQSRLTFSLEPRASLGRPPAGGACPRCRPWGHVPRRRPPTTCGAARPGARGQPRGLGHVFPPERYPFPDDDVLARWALVLDEPGVTVLVRDREAGGLDLFAAYDDRSLRHLAVHPTTGARPGHAAVDATVRGPPPAARPSRSCGAWRRTTGRAGSTSTSAGGPPPTGSTRPGLRTRPRCATPGPCPPPRADAGPCPTP